MCSSDLELCGMSEQALVTSHSPYVAEYFLPNQIVVLNRTTGGTIVSQTTAPDAPVREKILRQNFRFRYAEGLLGKAVLVVEGWTEFYAIPAASELLCGTATSLPALDLVGLIVVPADGDGDLAKVAGFYERLGIPAYVLCDQVDDDTMESIEGACTDVFEHPYKGFEDIYAEELDIEVGSVPGSGVAPQPSPPRGGW